MTNKVLEILSNPKNVGQMRDANGKGKVKGTVCKDYSKLFIKVENGVIMDTRFQTYGGAVSIAAASVVSELIKGKTLQSALKVTKEDVFAELGSLTKQEKECAENALGLIASAVNNYYKKQSKEIEQEEDEEEAPQKVAVAKAAKKEFSKKPKKEKETKPVEEVAKPQEKQEEKPAVEKKPAVEEKVEKKEEPKSQESSVTVLTSGNADGEVEVDIFSEIDAITAKISEAVNRLKKN